MTRSPFPPTIQALLAARLDQLEPRERSVLQCGAVEGRTFHRGRRPALDPEETELDGPPDRARAQGAHPPGRRAVPPGSLPFPSPSEQRRRLRSVAEGDPGRAPRAIRRLARRARRATSSSSTRCSATTSSRRLGSTSELGRPGAAAAARAAGRLGAAGLGARSIGRHGRRDQPPRTRDSAASSRTTTPGSTLELELGEALQEAGRLTEAEALLEQTAVRAALGGQSLAQRGPSSALAACGFRRGGESERLELRRELEQLVADFERARDDHRDCGERPPPARRADGNRARSRRPARARSRARPRGRR